MQIDLTQPVVNYKGTQLQAQTGVDDAGAPILAGQTVGDLILLGLAERENEPGLGPKDKLKNHRIAATAEKGGKAEFTVEDLTFVKERCGRETSMLNSLGYGRLMELIGEPDESGTVEPTAPAPRRRPAVAKKAVKKRAPAKRR